MLHQLLVGDHLAHLQPTAVTGLGGEGLCLLLAHLVDLFNGAVLLTTHEFDVDYLVDDGDVVFVELPEVGAHTAVRAEIAVVESVKAANDLFIPMNKYCFVIA